MPLSPAQLAELIDRHAASLRLWVQSRHPEAEDIVQEAFCRLAVLDPQPEKPVAWLYRVCRNLAETARQSDARRRRRESAYAPREASRIDPGEVLESAELSHAVEKLDAELREVLVARVWGQLSLEEVGALCGISTATAWRRYQAALEALRTTLSVPCEDNR